MLVSWFADGAQLVERLLSMHKALGLSPANPQTCMSWWHTPWVLCSPETWELEEGHQEFKTSLGYLRPCFLRKQNKNISIFKFFQAQCPYIINSTELFNIIFLTTCQFGRKRMFSLFECPAKASKCTSFLFLSKMKITQNVTLLGTHELSLSCQMEWSGAYPHLGLVTFDKGLALGQNSIPILYKNILLWSCILIQ